MSGDATNLGRYVRCQADAVLTSPPYHGAVDYYRRHQLEMFWLALTETQAERLELLKRYVGRPHVPPRHIWVSEALTTPLATGWDEKISRVSKDRGDALVKSPHVV